MDSPQRYAIRYTETALLDIEEKADYIAQQLRDSALAAQWYRRLKASIQEELSFLPLKYPLYDVSPWKERGVRLLITRNDVILYSVEPDQRQVYILGICTRGRDLTRHLQENEG